MSLLYLLEWRVRQGKISQTVNFLLRIRCNRLGSGRIRPVRWYPICWSFVIVMDSHNLSFLPVYKMTNRRVPCPGTIPNWCWYFPDDVLIFFNVDLILLDAVLIFTDDVLIFLDAVLYYLKIYFILFYFQNSEDSKISKKPSTPGLKFTKNHEQSSWSPVSPWIIKPKNEVTFCIFCTTKTYSLDKCEGRACFR